MSKAIYWQRGESLDYKNTTDATIPANTILLVGTILGVAGTDIEAGETGSLHVSGVWKMPLVSGTAVNMGDALYWSESDSKLTKTEGSNVKVGVASASATSADTEILVRLA